MGSPEGENGYSNTKLPTVGELLTDKATMEFIIEEIKPLLESYEKKLKWIDAYLAKFFQKRNRRCKRILIMKATHRIYVLTKNQYRQKWRRIERERREKLFAALRE